MYFIKKKQKKTKKSMYYWHWTINIPQKREKITAPFKAKENPNSQEKHDCEKGKELYKRLQNFIKKKKNKKYKKNSKNFKIFSKLPKYYKKIIILYLITSFIIYKYLKILLIKIFIKKKEHYSLMEVYTLYSGKKNYYWFLK